MRKSLLAAAFGCLATLTNPVWGGDDLRPDRFDQMNRALTLLASQDPARLNEGVRLLEQAAADGAPVYFMLGDIYRFGTGVERDLTRAAHWYRIGAETGDAMAQLELARLHLVGKGVPQDLVLAGVYLALAEMRLREPRQRTLATELANHVRLRASRADQERIRQQVRDWRPKPLEDLLN